MSAQISINRIKKTRLVVPLLGVTPLIVHQWDEKSKRQMRDKHQGKTVAKTVRDPKADYEASLYRTNDGRYGFPALAFKAAIVRGGKNRGIKMTDARQFIFVDGVPHEKGQTLLTVIEGEPHMREDVVRVGMTTDLRYRGEFTEWKAKLHISTYPDLLAVESLINLIEFAGETVGVGEWRPEKDGFNGTFTIDSDEEMQVFEQ